MKNKKISFDWGWIKGHCALLPTIILDTYLNQFAIRFRFLGFWFEIDLRKEINHNVN